jgi:hypothetical protein
MFVLQVNNKLSTPALFVLARKINNLKLEVSSEIEGFKLIQEDGEVLVQGESRKELMQGIRELM